MLIRFFVISKKWAATERHAWDFFSYFDEITAADTSGRVSYIPSPTSLQIFSPTYPWVMTASELSHTRTHCSSVCLLSLWYIFSGCSPVGMTRLPRQLIRVSLCALLLMRRSIIGWGCHTSIYLMSRISLSTSPSSWESALSSQVCFLTL